MSTTEEKVKDLLKTVNKALDHIYNNEDGAAMYELEQLLIRMKGKDNGNETGH